MNRVCHYLKALRTSETLQQAVFVDTETHEIRISPETVKHVLTFGFAQYLRRGPSGNWGSEDWLRFEDKDIFWNWLESHTRSRTKLYLFCHNTGFDLCVLDTFSHLLKRDWKIEIAIIENPPTILRFRKNKASLYILDTLNYWKTSLEKLGKSVGLSKLTMPKNSCSTEEWDVYCKRDVEILSKAVTTFADFIKDNDFGGFAHTIAAQAKKTYQHKFMKSPIAIHNNDDVCLLEREAFHGGRTEAFKLNHLNGRWHLLDYNQQYLSCMRDNLYPVKLGFSFKERTLENLVNMVSRGCVVARVMLNTLEPIYPIVENSKLIFPVGEFTTCLNTPELITALNRKHIVKILNGAWYECAPIFYDYANTMYQLRIRSIKDNNEVWSDMFKLLGNSLYGKFGQNGFVYEKQEFDLKRPNGNWIEIDYHTGKESSWRALNGLVQKLSRQGESRDSFPAIAAHVTAYGRIMLWETIEKAGIRNVAYVDTDSLLVNDTGLANLKLDIDANLLGKLKLEHTFNDCMLFALKDYTFDDKNKHKGIRANANWIGANVVLQEQWSSLKGALREGHLDYPTTTILKKELKRVYNKGIVGDDGDISPFSFSNGILVESKV